MDSVAGPDLPGKEFPFPPMFQVWAETSDGAVIHLGNRTSHDWFRKEERAERYARASSGRGEYVRIWVVRCVPVLSFFRNRKREN